MTREQAINSMISHGFTVEQAGEIIKAVTLQEPTTQERQAESDKFDAVFQDGYDTGYAQARFDYEQEPKTGHWEWYRCDMYICSECKNVYTDLSGIKDGMNYCPNCGSRNEVKE